MKFADLPLTPSILKSLERMTYSTPTDVQARTIPLVLEGRDVLVTAQTGTGKTAAFTVPILQKMIAKLDADEVVPRALILAPTRELAEQTGAVLKELTFFNRRVRYAVVIGGAPYPKQFRELGLNPAFVVGTPGRIIDHIESGTLKLADFDTLVLDEADRMLDMGFAPQIEMVVKKFPGLRQTMMFSATLPAEVRGLVAKYLSQPARVAIGEENRPVARIQQDVVELYEHDKDETLIREIDKVAGSMIVFTKTRLRADLVASTLQEAGHKVAPLHGELGQSLRRRVTNAFRDGEIRILVATDIAARGLDIDHVRHVINYDLPMLPEDYIHRIGRTGRNGAEGHSIAFVTPQEKHRWGQILKLMSGAGASAGGQRRGYKNASSKGAFSGAPRETEDRRKPFTNAYVGPTERDIRSAAPQKRGGKHAPMPVRNVKPARGAAPHGRGGKTNAREVVDEKARKLDPSSYDDNGNLIMNRAAKRAAVANKGKPKSHKPEEPRRKTAGSVRLGGGGGRGGAAGTGGGSGGYHSSHAKKVREEFQARVETLEERKARVLGRKPRFTGESNARRAGLPAPALKPGQKPHKGAPDMRKRRKPRPNA
jgi:ATP-dependent RNA helicase DeaD